MTPEEQIGALKELLRSVLQPILEEILLKVPAPDSDPYLDRKALKSRGYGRYAIDDAIRRGELQEGPMGPRGVRRVLQSELARWEASRRRTPRVRKAADNTWADEEAAEVARLRRLARGGE